MADGANVRIVLVLPKALFAEIIAYRFIQRLPSRTEAIRRLLRSSLAAQRSAPPDA